MTAISIPHAVCQTSQHHDAAELDVFSVFILAQALRKPPSAETATPIPCAVPKRKPTLQEEVDLSSVSMLVQVLRKQPSVWTTILILHADPPQSWRYMPVGASFGYNTASASPARPSQIQWLNDSQDPGK